MQPTAYTYTWRCRLYLMASCLALLLLSSCLQTKEKAYELLLQRVYTHSVPTISPAQLHVSMQQATPPLLLDTRSWREFEVSHLAGAKLFTDNAMDLSQLNDVPKDSPIVVYCSVGVRSERVGDRLLQAGYTNVSNLEGGLFAWVNNGLPVYDWQGESKQVHAYTFAWGIWLHRGEKVYD